ncbi:hypothetical protein RHSIM_Rhsim11G0043900 [Rhododendron simsii]|uniref:Uncharacterized protein n=1 Tax=Rhododendron simsii TaxID=118357 RepID=A0A834G9P6_RHOSS|nr:hypothetical protein RHSIM_Rhsim11G0043900 [Rhododendron simsii]
MIYHHADPPVTVRFFQSTLPLSLSLSLSLRRRIEDDEGRIEDDNKIDFEQGFSLSLALSLSLSLWLVDISEVRAFCRSTNKTSTKIKTKKKRTTKVAEVDKGKPSTCFFFARKFPRPAALRLLNMASFNGVTQEGEYKAMQERDLLFASRSSKLLMPRVPLGVWSVQLRRDASDT